jgi:hypothetical protein
MNFRVSDFSQIIFSQNKHWLKAIIIRPYSKAKNRMPPKKQVVEKPLLGRPGNNLKMGM